jgi:hypothetical protein
LNAVCAFFPQKCCSSSLKIAAFSRSFQFESINQPIHMML